MSSLWGMDGDGLDDLAISQPASDGGKVVVLMGSSLSSKGYIDLSDADVITTPRTPVAAWGRAQPGGGPRRRRPGHLLIGDWFGFGVDGVFQGGSAHLFLSSTRCAPSDRRGGPRQLLRHREPMRLDPVSSGIRTATAIRSPSSAPTETTASPPTAVSSPSCLLPHSAGSFTKRTPTTGSSAAHPPEGPHGSGIGDLTGDGVGDLLIGTSSDTAGYTGWAQVFSAACCSPARRTASATARPLLRHREQRVPLRSRARPYRNVDADGVADPLLPRRLRR